MSTNSTARSSPATPLSPPPPQPAAIRLIVLLVLLGIAIAALAYDYLSAGPGIEADDKKLEVFVDETNRQGVAKTKRLTPDEIHTLLGRTPTWVDKHPEEQYEVEYYCNWGMVPVLNMRRHFLAVVYVGDEPRRYNSHHKNERPPLEALPIEHKAPEETGEVAAPTSTADPSKGGEAAADAAAPSEGAPPEGAKKREGKKQQEASPEEKPAQPPEEKPAQPQTEKSEQPQVEKKDN